MKTNTDQVIYGKLSKKAIFHNRIKGWGMVFFFVLLFSYIMTIFWSGRESADPKWQQSAGGSSRISVKVRDINHTGGSQVGYTQEAQSGKTFLNISMEEYLYGCLPTVMPADYELECLKAQAVLLRTYLIGRYKEAMAAGDGELAEAWDTYLTGNQLRELWGSDFDENYKKVIQAVTETRGIYMTYEGKPAHACYFRVSAGATRDGSELLLRELPYLKSVECPKDYLSEDYLYQVVLKSKNVENIIGGSIGEIRYDRAGYCKEVVILMGDNKDMAVSRSGEWLRIRLDFPSSHFQLEQDGNNMTFTIKGTGHGLGMSQFTANELAKEGYDFDSILTYFFQNIVLDKYE